MSQRDTVARMLRTYGGLTTVNAKLHGIGQIRTRVTELRQAGWLIDTHHDPQAGVVYVLRQEPGQPPRQLQTGL